MAEENFPESPVQAPNQTNPLLRLFSQENRRVLLGVIVVSVVVITFALSNDSAPSQDLSRLDAAKAVQDREKEKKKRRKIKYEKLFNQLEGADSSKILKELSLKDIPFRTEQVGQKFTIFVDEQELAQARNLLAIKGLPAGKLKKGYELLDGTQTLGVTEFDKRIRFLRALSGEIESAIVQLEIIESAKVQIVLPEQRLFTVTQPPVTASIVVRLVKGRKINDRVVFSVIQFVANAVENLQPENVSVIDTSGNLLSDNIFERLVNQQVGARVELDPVRPVVADISREDAIGSPIIPNYDRIQEWFEIKWQFEKRLREKVERQLLGVLPLGSFKVEFTSDLGPLENGDIVDIKRQTISIVVDGLNDDLVIDQAFKKQVFQTVSGTSGYIRGRDSIQLSIAEFPLYTPEGLQQLKERYATRGILKLVAMAGIGGVMIGGLYFGYRGIRNRGKLSKDTDTVKSESLSNELAIQDATQLNEPKQQRLRALAKEKPEILAQIIEEWITTDDTAEELDSGAESVENAFMLEGET